MKTTQKEIDVFNLTISAVKEVRDGIFQCALDAMIRNFQIVEAKLKEHAMDLDLAYPAPNSFTCNRKQYVTLKKARANAESYFTLVEPNRSSRLGSTAPRIVSERPEACAIMRDTASRHADDSVISFARKLTLKIMAACPKSLTVTAITHQGFLFQGSCVTCTTDSDLVLKFKTKIVINCSCLGKLFNQYPTRLSK